MASDEGDEDCGGLLERAYRVALLLQSACQQRFRLGDDGLEALTLSTEVLDLVDKARAALVRSKASEHWQE